MRRSVKLDISRGAIVQAGGRLFKIIDDTLAFGQVEARDIELGRLERLSITSLEPPVDEVKPTAPDLSTLDSADVEEARRRLDVIGPLLKLPRRRKSDIEDAMAALEVGKTTLYRWMNDYAHDGRLTSLCPRKRPGGRGKSRLDPDLDRIVQSVIEEHYLKPVAPSAKSTVREINRRCRNANLNPPHENTIRARLHAIPEKTQLKRRGQSKKANDLFTAKPGHFEDAKHPLSIVQVDHTPLDVVLVDEEYRLPLQRPYLTLAIDVYSRMILSFYLSFEKPGALAAGLCIARAILPKDDWLLRHGIKQTWPCWGFPAMIHLDNAREFRGEMLRLACKQYDIEVDFRQVATPSMGGHIERALGTVTRQAIHDLAGTAKKPVDRGSYDSEANADTTLRELEVRLTDYITGIYHQQYHTGIGTTPIRRWTDAILGDGKNAGIGQFPKATDEERLRIDFMPVEKRMIRKEGVRIDGIFYYDDALRPFIHGSRDGSTTFVFHRDPRDISTIYFWDPDVQQYIRVPYKNATHPPISVWELRIVRAHLESQGRSHVDESVIFETYERLREHEERARRETRAVRRNNERRAALERSKPPAPKNITPPTAVDATTNQVPQANLAPAPKRFEFIPPLEMEEEV
jgi:putative transposase